MQSAEPPANEPNPPFRTPGEPAFTAELLKFLIDRTGYIKQLEAEDTPEAYSRIENLRELVNAALDSKDRGETSGAISRPRCPGERRRRLRRIRPHHPDDSACREGSGVPAGVPLRSGRRSVPALAHAARNGRHRGRTPPLLRRHDPCHGHADPKPGRLPPPLRDRSA